MSKHSDPLLEALLQGQPYTWTVPDGGDLASMRKAIKHGQTLTISPILDPKEIQIGDMVEVKWHKSTIFHVVGDIQGDRFLITNSLGKVNGWVAATEILGRVTHIIEPEPRPDVPIMLDQFESACRQLIGIALPSASDLERLLSIVDDLRWYSSRIGEERWRTMPRSNKWSFEQNLWWLTRRLRNDAASPSHKPLQYYIDRGKHIVGLSAEILSLFEPDMSDE